MGEIRESVNPVLFFIAGFSSAEGPLEWARARAEATFGPIELESPYFQFSEFTKYYEREMGERLLKRFWAFRTLVDPGELAAAKCLTNAWEEEAKNIFGSENPGRRPLNLDPGYIDLGKLVLASTKDFSHRIYLRDGIFAEVTLIYTKKSWQSLPWSYADYQSDDYQRFFTVAREYLADEIRKVKKSRM